MMFSLALLRLGSPAVLLAEGSPFCLVREVESSSTTMTSWQSLPSLLVPLPMAKGRFSEVSCENRMFDCVA